MIYNYIYFFNFFTRIIPNTNEIIKYVIEIKGIVLNTYDLNNIYYQYIIIKNSNIIILGIRDTIEILTY